MALDPLHCLSAIVFAGITKRRRSTDTDSQAGIKKWFLGIASGLIVGLSGGLVGGYLGGAIALAQHEVKLDQLKERQAEDRAEYRSNNNILSDRLRELELKRR